MAVQAHHILPNAIYARFDGDIRMWTNGSYQQNAGYNLTPLPTTPTDASGARVAQHIGSHPWLNNAWENTIEAINDLDLPDTEKGRYFQAAHTYFRDALDFTGTGTSGNFTFLNLSDPAAIEFFDGTPTGAQMNAFYSATHTPENIFSSAAFQEGLAGTATNGAFGSVNADIRVFETGSGNFSRGAWANGTDIPFDSTTGTFTLKAGVIGITAEAARQAGFVGDILSIGITAAHAEALYEQGDIEAAGRLYTGFAFEFLAGATASSIAVGAVLALPAVAAAGAVSTFAVAAIAAVAAGAIAGGAAREFGEFIYDQNPAFFDGMIDETREGLDNFVDSAAAARSFLDSFVSSVGEMVTGSDLSVTPASTAADVAAAYVAAAVDHGEATADDEFGLDDFTSDGVPLDLGPNFLSDAGLGDIAGDATFSVDSDLRLDDSGVFATRSGVGLVTSDSGVTGRSVFVQFSNGVTLSIRLGDVSPEVARATLARVQEEMGNIISGLSSGDAKSLIEEILEETVPQSDGQEGTTGGAPFLGFDIIDYGRNLADWLWDFQFFNPGRYFGNTSVTITDGPLLFDLNDNGVLLDRSDAVRHIFDLDGDGFDDNLTWMEAGDGMLVYDHDSDGQITDASEFVFSTYVTGAASDLAGLRYFDSNTDDFLSAADADWALFKVWADGNQNGVVDSGELVTLDSLGVTSIALSHTSLGSSLDPALLSQGVFGRAATNLPAVEVFDVTFDRSVVGTQVLAEDANATTWIAEENGPVSLEWTATGPLTFTAGTSTLLGRSLFDQIFASDTADLIDFSDASAGVTMWGLLGDDQLTGGLGDDFLVGGAGNDTLLGGPGDDVLAMDSADGLVDGGAGNDVLLLSDPAMTGVIRVEDYGAEHAFARGGAQHLIGQSAGGSMLFGGDGNDTLTGHGFDDALSGDGGNDSLVAAGGRDFLYGGAGADTLDGGAGDDLFVVDAAGTNDVIRDGGGTDTLTITEGAGLADLAFTLAPHGAGADLVIEGPGGVIATITDYSVADPQIEFLSLAETNMLIDLRLQPLVGGTAGADNLSTSQGLALVSGGTGGDVLTLTASAQGAVAVGGKGNDAIDIHANGGVAAGGVGDDTLTHQGGDDVALDGGAGDDVISIAVGNSATVIFGEGSGHDVVDGGGPLTRFAFMDDIQFEDLAFELSGDGSSVTIGRATDAGRLDSASPYSLTINGLTAILAAGPIIFSFEGQADMKINRFLEGSAVSDRIEAITAEEFEIIVAGGITIPFTVVADSSVWLQGFEGDDTLRGTDFPDLVDGGSGNDTIDGFAGNDTLLGGDGADTLYGGVGLDLLLGGAGADFATGNEGDDTLEGGSGDDQLRGGVGSDSLKGGGGDDQLFGRGNPSSALDPDPLGADGNNTLRGGDGDDTILGALGDDLIDGGIGRDRMSGYAGNDIFYAGTNDDTVFAAEGDDTIFGHTGDDLLFGDAGADVIDAGAGMDEAFGGPGADTLYGGDGADTLFGNTPNAPDDPDLPFDDAGDLIDGQGGADAIFGRFGDDRLFGGKGNDTLHGDDGADTVYGGLGADVIYGGAGNDMLVGDDGLLAA